MVWNIFGTWATNDDDDVNEDFSLRGTPRPLAGRGRNLSAADNFRYVMIIPIIALIPIIPLTLTSLEPKLIIKY